MKLLEGIRVLDISTVIAAPFAAGLMADFGAEVIKVEMPDGGDPFRRLGPYHEGQAMRFACMGRNKKSITLDLRMEKGKEIFLQLVEKSDVVIENFRTGTLDKWGIGYEAMKLRKQDIILSHVTGYGQTGPYKNIPGFGTPATAFSGMTYITGYPDRPPVSPSFSLTDYIAGLYTAMGTMMALYHRDALHGKGQEIDVSLYEGIFRFMEILCADYDKNGIIRERKPKLNGTSSPGGTYKTKDGKWVVLVCSTDRTWEYLAGAMHREDLMTNPLYETMRARVTNDNSLDKIVSDWIGSKEYIELKEIVDKAGVPVNLVYSIEDIFADPHYAARNDIVEMSHPVLGTIKMPGITPVFSETPGEIKWVGPQLGEHNDAIYEGLLGFSQSVWAEPSKLVNKINAMHDEIKELSSENEKLKAKLANDAVGDVDSQIKEVKGIKVLAMAVPDVDMNGLRNLGDQMKEKIGSGVVVLASAVDGKVTLLAMATDDAVKKGAHAGNLIKGIAALVGGGGGGRPNMAQAGGKNPDGIPAAIEKVYEVVESQL